MYLIQHLTLSALVALVSAALSGGISWLGPRVGPRTSRAHICVSPFAALVAAIGVFACLIAAAVKFPSSFVGSFASSPEAVEISAIVSAIAGAVVQGFMGWHHRGASPGA